jgi:hypothetical protein
MDVTDRVDDPNVLREQDASAALSLSTRSKQPAEFHREGPLFLKSIRAALVMASPVPEALEKSDFGPAFSTNRMHECAGRASMARQRHEAAILCGAIPHGK